jgi:hypothetical protein
LVVKRIQGEKMVDRNKIKYEVISGERHYRFEEIVSIVPQSRLHDYLVHKKTAHVAEIVSSLPNHRTWGIRIEEEHIDDVLGLYYGSSPTSIWQLDIFIKEIPPYHRRVIPERPPMGDRAHTPRADESQGLTRRAWAGILNMFGR